VQQHLKEAACFCCMTSDQENDSTKPAPLPAKPSSEDMVRQLAEFPVEVLEAALLVLRMRQAEQ